MNGKNSETDQIQRQKVSEYESSDDGEEVILVINAPMGSTIDVPLEQFQFMQNKNKEEDRGQFDS